VPPKLYGETDQ